MKKILIGDFIPGEEKEIYSLVKTVFDEFVAPDYNWEGNSFFTDYIQPEKIIERFLDKEEIIITAKADGSIIGVLDARAKSHISLLFVAKEFQGKRVSSLMLDAFLQKLSKFAITEITVHASPGSVKVYESLGFKGGMELKDNNGMRYLPMYRNI